MTVVPFVVKKNPTMTLLPPARILAIESSCDETACAVLENGRALLASTVASQMERAGCRPLMPLDHSTG